MILMINLHVDTEQGYYTVWTDVYTYPVFLIRFDKDISVFPYFRIISSYNNNIIRYNTERMSDCPGKIRDSQ